MIEAKKRAEEFEKVKEVMVQEAQSVLDEELKTGKSIPIGPIEGSWWDLYSSEYLAHYFVEERLGKRLLFGKIYDNLGDIPGVVCRPGQVSTELYIYPESYANLFWFAIFSTVKLFL